MRRTRKIKIDLDERQDLTRIIPRQNLDTDNSPFLREFLLRQLKKKNSNSFIVDLGSVDSVDTSGLATLVEFALSLREKGGSVCICGLKHDTIDSLPLKQVSDVLDLCKNEISTPMQGKNPAGGDTGNG